MFSDKSKTKQDFTKDQNKIAQGTKFVGEIISKGSIRIEGEVEGKIEAKGKVVVGKTGIVNGEITCNCADIEGTTFGNINNQSVLTLKSTANVNSEVVTDKLVVEAGAKLNASCKMTSSVKSINDAAPKQEKEALQA